MSFAHTLGQDDTVFVNLREMQVRIEVGSGNEMTVRSKPTVYLNPRGHGVFSLETIKRQLPGVSARNISVQASGGSVAAAVINGAVSLGSGGPKVQQALTTITAQKDDVEGLVITMPSGVGYLELVAGNFSGDDEARSAGVRFS